MLVEVKKVNPSKRELSFQVDKERVSKTLSEVYADLGKTVKVKGFRPGKVPRNVLESSHRKVAEEEVIRKLIPEVYHEGITNENLQPIDMPDIQDVQFKDGQVSFKAVLDIKPEVEVKKYKELKVKRKTSTVTDDEIEKTLEYFKKGQGDAEEKKIDDEFARGLGYPNLDDFKKSIARQMEIDKDRQNRADVENQIIDQLLKNAKVTAPDSLVTKQLERRLSEEVKHLQKHGMPDDEIKKKEDELRVQLKDVVERDIKVYLVLDKIAEIEKIEIKEGENLPAKMMEFLMKEAKWEETKS